VIGAIALAVLVGLLVSGFPLIVHWGWYTKRDLFLWFVLLGAPSVAACIALVVVPIEMGWAKR
jgi:hypothetical protein